MNAAFLLLTTSFLAADPSGALQISPVILKTVGEIEVPAVEAGVLSEVQAKPGKFVKEGDSLSRIEDAQVRLTLERTRLEAEIAQRKMENDLQVRAAKKSVDVAKAEYARSVDTNRDYPKTVSQSELDRQRLMVERGELEALQAEQDQIEARLKRDICLRECELAEEQLRRRHITAPCGGMLVDVPHERGEWVQPGDVVARLVRMDVLRAEGFLPAKQATLDLIGRKVELKLSDDEDSPVFAGEIVFVSPDIDPLNNQVRVWAEIQNTDRQLRPGLQGTIEVLQP